MNQVLFICTGNYYRSRYAEILFNFTASDYDLSWTSFSRGFQDSTRKAPISQHALAGLQNKEIYLNQVRYPIKLTPADLAMAHRIILMDESEHKPMLHTHFAEWSDHVEYWNIQDVDFENPESALGRLDRKIDLLIGSLETENNQFLWENNHLKVRFS
jgi:protein-tyrosine phosphatase